MLAGCDRLARRTLMVLALMMSAACPAAQAAAGLTLDRLMSSLAQRHAGQVSYVEKDYLRILDRPVSSSGVLLYRAPDWLEKRTLQPRKESLIVEGDELTVARGRRKYQLQLSAYPQVAPLVDAIRDTLAGNGQALEKVFRVSLAGSLQQWQLRLVPLDAGVARKVRWVQISGAADAIAAVEILQVDGDRSVMTLGAPSGTRDGG